MKTNILLTSLLTLSILTPVAAMAAAECEPNNPQLNSAQRTASIKQCLAQVSSPANVKRIAAQQKIVGCEQNAKNLALQGSRKAEYITTCVTRNDAKEAAEAMATPKMGVPESFESINARRLTTLPRSSHNNG